VNNNKINLESIKVGDQMPIYSVIIDEKMYRKYNRLVNEINPLHFNKKYAQKLGFEDIVVAGNFTFGYIPKWIIDWTRDLGCIDQISVYFEKPVFINDQITHKGRVIKIDVKNDKKFIECSFTVEKTIDNEIVTRGYIQLSFQLID
jgi:acyl dehydratase